MCLLRFQLRRLIQRFVFAAVAALATVHVPAFPTPARAETQPSGPSAPGQRAAPAATVDDASASSSGSAITSLLPLPAMFGIGAPKGQPLWRETTVGADVTPRSWLAYTGATVSPFGDLWSEGWRLRATTGYGTYRYIGNRFDPDTQAEARLAFTGRATFFEGLVGYLWRLGPLTAKAFAGVTTIDHQITPADYLASSGARLGAKGVVELWLNIGETAWASLDAGYATAHRTFAVRSRAGYRLASWMTIGVESGINGSTGFDADGGTTPLLDPQHRDLRFGGFARVEWCGGEISLSGGMSTDLGERREPYGTVGFIYQF